MKIKSEFLNTLQQRGYLHQCTNLKALDEALGKPGHPAGAYIGFDLTAPGLHVGSLLPIMVLRIFQKTGIGQQAIALLGGGTTLIGDPSGKDQSRKILDPQEIQDNEKIIHKILTEAIPGVTVRNNRDWLKELDYVTFLRDYGKHLSVNRMLTHDSVKLRLEREQNLSFLEFNYMAIQAYDFVHLARTEENLILQMGGSDQWGNIIQGIELARRRGDIPHPLHGLTMPLIMTSEGTKMGKTAKGTIWLNQDPYNIWQFWRNTKDQDLPRFLRLFTEIPLDEIHKLDALRGEETNEAKIRLADAATEILFARSLSQDELRKQAQEIPVITISREELERGIPLFRVFGKLAGSNAQAKRVIQQGGARINDIPVPPDAGNQNLALNVNNVNNVNNEDNQTRITLGKKNHAIIQVT